MELLKRLGIGLFVVTILVLAVIVGGIRLAIVNIDYFESEIRYLLQRDVSPGIVFSGLSGDMNRFNPILRIENVSVNLPDRSQPLYIDRLEVEFDFWASLRAQAPVVLEASGKLEKLELVKDESGNWWTNELAITSDAERGPAPAFKQVLGLLPRYVKLNLNRLIVLDRQAGATHQLERVAANLNREQDQYFIQISAALPEQLGRGLLVKSIIGPESSVIYVNSSSLQLAPVARLLDLDTWGLQRGALDGEVWINMAGYDVLAVNGDLVLKNGVVQMAADKTPLAVSYHSRFSAIKRSSSWRITNRFIRLAIDNENVLGFRTQVEVGDKAGEKIVSAWVDRLQLSSLPVVVGQWLPADVNREISQGRLQGVLQDILLSIDLEQPEDFRLGARAVRVSSLAFAKYPGAENLDADLLMSRHRLGARIYGDNVSLDFGDHFRAPIELDRLELRATVARYANGLVLSVDDFQARNEDIRASGRMWLEFDQHERPFAYIRAGFSEGQGSSTSKYLPRKILPLKTQAWLDRGIKNGYVPAGEMLFHGRVRKIGELDRNRAGEFFVDFNVENADVFFAPEWLHARNGAGRVRFHNVGMEIDLERVSYDRLDNARARAVISNFAEPVLELVVDTDTSADQALRAFVDTPVGDRYRGVLTNLHDLDGAVSANIDLRMPLKQAAPEPEVKVTIDFDNASAKSDSWGLDLTHINGRLRVIDKSIMADRIEARFFQDPVTIDVKPVKSNGRTLVNVNGILESSNLLRRLPERYSREVNGKSDWQVRLSFSGESPAAEQPYLRLSAASNLYRTAVTLPKPLSKPAEDTTRVSAELDFFHERIGFMANFGADLRARGWLAVDAAKNISVATMDLAFASELRPASAAGINFYGYLPEVSISDWAQAIDNVEAAPSLLRSVDLKIDRVHALNRILDKVSVDVRLVDAQFLGSIESSLVKGSFQIPQRPSASDPLVIELEYLKLEKQQQQSDYSRLRPIDFGRFRIHSKAVDYHGIPFNDVALEGRSGNNVLAIEQFRMRRNQVALSGSAQWEFDPASGAHTSIVSTSIEGEKFGEAIAGIGFGDTMRGGKIVFKGEFTWPGPLPGFELDHLAGNASLKIRDGVLNNVEPGSGRFVGLLSLSALPRRLSLDFSDVLIKGMEFEEITGDYRLENGVLETTNTRMDGPAARIRISGKTDILKRDYDQQIMVTPKIRQTLPVIGAISAGNTVGWGLLLLQNLFKKAIDNAVEVEYRVTGSWDDPQIKLVKAVDENQQELPEYDR